MKNLSKISILALTFMLSVYLFNFVVLPAQASCICAFKPDIMGKYDPANGTYFGLYKFINDGGQTCQQVFGGSAADGGACDPYGETITIDNWQPPTLSENIGNIIRLIFFTAGLFALVYLLLGVFEWLQSRGDEKKIDQARSKIVNAVVGLIVLISALALVIFLEQVVFGGKICLGISCPMNIGFPRLLGK